MKWTDCAIQDLKGYNAKINSVHNIKERIEILEISFSSLKGGAVSNTGVRCDNGNKVENSILDNIVERDKLKLLLQINIRLVKLINKGLSQLDDTEKTVIQHFFIDRPDNHMQKLTKKLNLEQAQIYRIKDRALEKFVKNMYGLEAL